MNQLLKKEWQAPELVDMDVSLTEGGSVELTEESEFVFPQTS